MKMTCLGACSHPPPEEGGSAQECSPVPAFTFSPSTVLHPHSCLLGSPCGPDRMKTWLLEGSISPGYLLNTAASWELGLLS